MDAQDSGKIILSLGTSPIVVVETHNSKHKYRPIQEEVESELSIF
jgi:hypothetical protein